MAESLTDIPPNKRSAKIAESLVDLPPNILIEILARLPLRTLLASRYVCKTFLNLTTLNPHFIALHSSNATQSLLLQFEGDSKPSTLLRLVEPELDLSSAFVDNFRSRPIFQIPKIRRNFIYYRCNFRDDENNFVLVNSCNGLVYIVRRDTPADERSLVCNPVTNEYVMIAGAYDEGFRTMSMWLGFSPGSNQYKVLRIFTSTGNGGEPLEVGARLLVVGPNSWIATENEPLAHGLSWDMCSTFLNGVIYWLDESWKDIVLFDFDKYMFGEIALPPEFGEEQMQNVHCMSTGMLGGCLSLSYYDQETQHISIWVMKKRGNGDCWSKEFIVDTVRPMGRTFKPLQVLRNGEIVMLQIISNDIVCYDPKTKRLRFVDQFRRLRLKTKVVAFTPSFISLKDALLVDKVLVQNVRPRGNETDP